MKKDIKRRLLLQELEKDPHQQLNIVFFLISIIPILTVVYLFCVYMLVPGNDISDSIRIIILIGVILVLGYALGYRMIQEIVDKALSFAARAKKADELKSKFALSLAHDLKSPLSVIKTNISAMRAGYHGDLNDTQKKCVETCDEVSDRMSSLIIELIDTYKFEARENGLHLIRFNLCDIVKEQMRELEPIAHLKNITLTLDCPSKEVTAEVDTDKMIRAVNNILNNSMKYTQVNGNVTVRLSVEAGLARMDFVNNGPQIPEEKLEKIFDKFERLNASKDGHGLGLAIAKDIIELHDGTIRASSGPGKPNTFTVSLPLAR